MKRNVYKSLESWSRRAKRKPLLLGGARQVGKTWLVRELGKTFENFVEYNLESQPETHEFFKKNFGDPAKLIKFLEADSGQMIRPGRTLILPLGSGSKAPPRPALRDETPERIRFAGWYPRRSQSWLLT